MYPLFIYPKNIDLISYRKDGKIMSDFNMIDNEVTETLGAMLPQVPLSGQTIEFITDPYYEMNDYINEGIAQDSSNVSKGLGSKLKVSIQTRRLIMKIAIQEKRVELAKKRKFYSKYVPKLEAELTLYKKKLEQIKDSATPEELSDINKVEVASKQAVESNQTLKESVDDLFIELGFDLGIDHHLPLVVGHCVFRGKEFTFLVLRALWCTKLLVGDLVRIYFI